MNSSLPTLVYVADPLCGWCYGFTPVIEKLSLHYKDALLWDFRVGGMAVGEHVKPMAEVAPTIRPAITQIQERTGALFTKAFTQDLLSRPDIQLDSILPCAAMVYFKNHSKTHWPAILAAYHQGFFTEGLAPNSDELLARAAAIAEIPVAGLLQAITSDENLAALRQEFAIVKGLSVTVFPSLVLVQPAAMGQSPVVHPVIEGYAPYERVSALLDRLLSAHLALD